MPTLLHMQWLWLFGALSAGIVVGWLGYRLIAARWTSRRWPIAIGAVAVALLLGIAELAPARYGARIEIFVVLAVIGAIGGFVGWALRDIAEFAPAATRPTAASATSGSYLFRDAFTGMGGTNPYMRATSGHGSPTQARTRPVPSNASLAQAPAAGGYTFPKILPFADATKSRSPAGPGQRRHWSWPA